MKKLPAILAVTTLVTSIGAYANVLRNDASPFGVNVPNLKSGFEVSVEGSFLRPSSSDLNYGFIENYNSNTDQLTRLTARPDTHFAWGMGVGYVFPDSGNDVQLNWTEFSQSHHDFTSLPAEDNNNDFDFFTPAGNYLSAGSNGRPTAEARTKLKLTVVDLNAGQYLNVGNRLQLRPFAGLRYARVESNLDTNFYTVNQSGSAVLEETNNFKSKFSGLGPLLGVDANYQLGGGVGAAAHLATSLLIGKVNANSELIDDNYEYNVVSKDVWRVVPAFDAKLGLNYSYAFDCNSAVTMEGGYKVSQYLDVGHKETFDSDWVPIPATKSVGFAGPYVKLSFKF